MPTAVTEWQYIIAIMVTDNNNYQTLIPNHQLETTACCDRTEYCQQLPYEEPNRSS